MKFVPTKEIGPKGETKEEMEKKMQQRVTADEWKMLNCMRSSMLSPGYIINIVKNWLEEDIPFGTEELTDLEIARLNVFIHQWMIK